MMSKTTIVGAVIVAVLIVLPAAALAEDASVQGSIQTSIYKMDGSATRGVTATATLPRGGVVRANLTASGTKPLPKGMDLRDKMMASGTKPIPAGIEARMEGRDGERMGMMGSDTPERHNDCSRSASSSNCVFGHNQREHRGEMLRHAAELIFHRIEAAIGRFNKIADRIDSRVAKLKSQGTDTTAAEENDRLARGKTKEAQDALDAAKALVVSATLNADASTTVSMDAGKPVREQLEKAKQALMDAAKHLEAAVAALKGLGKGGEGMHDGTSTPKLPGMMRTRDHMSTSTPDGHPDGTL